MGKKICRGCAMIYPGMVTGIVASLLVQWWIFLNDWEIGAVLYILVAITVLISITDMYRPLKDFARYFLGVVIGTSLVEIIVSPYLTIKLWVIINLAIFYGLMNWKRKGRNDWVCAECPEFKIRNDACSGFRTLKERQLVIMDRHQHGIRDAFAETSELLDDDLEQTF
ncbi:MAG: hypothetical protein ACXAEU_20535 [Candidatus Hodarchaeales archaeon]|jgi:hypothetical protein